MKKRFMLLMLALIALIPLLPAAAESPFTFLPTRVYDGVTYEARPPADITSILLIGYDHYAEGEDQALHGYSGGGQADLLLLVVLDHRADEIRMLQIDRDAMTRVRVTDANGMQHDRSSLQICLAHAYGDTREKNNANTVLAVETLLGIEGAGDGAAIDYYIAMDISGISRLNDLMGGVTVTVGEDMTALDPEMRQGARLTLTGEQAEIFCRARMGLGDQKNTSRMARQRQYMSAAGEKLRLLLREDAGFAARLLDGMGVIYDRSVAPDADPFSFAGESAGTPNSDAQGYWLMTSGTKKEITAAMALAAGYEAREPETLPGTHSLDSSGYIRFDVEGDAALQWALSAFYRLGK